MSTAEAATETLSAEASRVAAEIAGHARLKSWILREAPVGDRVREEFVLSCLSAILHRTVNFGIEDGLEVYSARELLQFQLMASAPMGALLAKVTATRAIVEDDQPVIQALADSGLCQAVIGWYHDLATAGASRSRELLTACAQDEELHTARVVVARRHPGLAEAAWLWDMPERLARVGAALALTLIRTRPDLLSSIAVWLERNPQALYSVDPDDLLAPLVAHAPERPQTILLPLEGAYGDPTVISAAEWHLEHHEPREALQLCAQVRPLSLEADRARAIAALARLELGEAAVARRIAEDILDPGWAAAVGVRLAERDPEQTSDDTLLHLARTMPGNRAEAFFTAVSLLVRRRALAAARSAALERGRDFASHPPVAELCKVLGVALG